MLESFSIIFISIVFEAVPFVLLGTLVSSLIEEFVSQEWILKRIGDSKIRFYFVAGIIGFIMPVCECAIVPIMRRLVKKGVPIGIGVTFMLATPIVNPIVLLSTSYAFFGDRLYVLTRGIAGYIAAIIIGMIVQRISAGKQVLNDKEVVSCSCGHDHVHHHEDNHNHDHNHQHEENHDHDHHRQCNHDHDHSHQPKESHEHNHIHDHHHQCNHNHDTNSSSRFSRILGHLSSEFIEVGRFLLFGAAIAAAMQTFIPRQVITGISNNSVMAVVVMMVLAFVLSLCSEADAFIAATFKQTFPNYAIIAFLIFGPMIDIKNTLMLLNGFKKEFVLKLVGVITVVCFSISMLLMLFI